MVAEAMKLPAAFEVCDFNTFTHAAQQSCSMLHDIHTVDLPNPSSPCFFFFAKQSKCVDTGHSMAASNPRSITIQRHLISENALRWGAVFLRRVFDAGIPGAIPSALRMGTNLRLWLVVA